MARPPRTNASPKSLDPTAWPAYLLSQVGAHAACCSRTDWPPLKLTPPHARILRAIDEADGLSQQALGETLGVFPSRLVALLDEWRGAGWSRPRQAGRPALLRLHLTDAGRRGVEADRSHPRQHQDHLPALDESEREQLAGYLRRIAEQQRLAPGIHPGWKLLGEGRSGKC